ncbi:Pre-mRNA-processing factor 31 [Neolecta irregularis DAH-3]|uniref:Pre-mRNA-processing factor 31 n=1 Tax=Neolecta irregularis (strain DAH-3) TaxID=1198029 RepID=A0A1U7LQ68_NEOID|nr:Pre-mRNA-processing factor 31 [Neolecta irregularis DAH-3]|eukprot:OLL24816.1 Pre-mRNA-processing factor 31 [Neolecta irregularis DAH-3]
MSLADELLADFGSDPEDQDHNQEEPNSKDGVHHPISDNDNEESTTTAIKNIQTDNADLTEAEQIEKIVMKEIQDVGRVAKVMQSKYVDEVLKQIDYYSQHEKLQIVGNIEDDPEYRLIVQANNVVVDIDNEILLFIRDHYGEKFTELESLVIHPLDYAKSVKAIGNETDITKVDLKFLQAATVMVVTVTSTTTAGSPLSEHRLNIVMKACDMALSLDAAKRKILDYVQSRMSLIAPNLSAIIGSSTAAKLIGIAGGLTALSKVPACNVSALGAKRATQIGFSTGVTIRHQGFLFHSELIQRTPPDFRKQAQRIVSGKIILAARIDRIHESLDGSVGLKLLDEVTTKLEKLSEPAPKKNVKALPAPDDPARRRRGGKRVRKQKEAFAVTELRRQQNRMAFGKEEMEVGVYDETVGLGMIGQSDQGKLRAAAADSRTKTKLPKHLRNRMDALRSSAGNTGNLDGTMSSLVMSSQQGISLVNPLLAEQQKNKLKEANEGYFSGIWTSVKK